MVRRVEQNKSLVDRKSYDRHIDIYDEENPESVFNMLKSNASYLRERIHTVPEEWRDCDQYTIRNEVNPTPTLNQLRLNFWAEYDRTLGSTNKNAKMNLKNICSGTCSLNLLKSYIDDPMHLAWILTPVQSYNSQAQDVMETAMYKLRQGLEKLEMTDVKELNTVIKIFEGFDKRMHGDYKKQVEVKEVRAVPAPDTEIKKEMTNLGIDNDVVVEYSKEE